MAVRKINLALPDSRKSVALRTDPTRVDPQKLKLGKQAARHDPAHAAAGVLRHAGAARAARQVSISRRKWAFLGNDGERSDSAIAPAPPPDT